MSRLHSDRAAELFDRAGDLPAGQRSAFLDEACTGDADLRREVEALLAADDTAGAFLSSPQFNPAEAAAIVGGGEAVGGRIGPYRLLELIGEGGFGRVFLAEQARPVRRRVALKVIKLGMDTRQVIARFEAERQALAIMDHPNIARVFDAGATEPGRPYFVMELVRGVPINRYCDAEALGVRERLRLFVSVCQAVQHAHQKGVIHRDLKPSNVLVTLIDGQPVPKIIDFGIAKATGGGAGSNATLAMPAPDRAVTLGAVNTEFMAFIGTPAYMSPEQALFAGDDIDTRSDVYSLGVMLYELLTGTTPFDTDTLRHATYAEVQRMIREVDPPRPSSRVAAGASTAGGRGVGAARALRSVLRGELDWVVMKCLEKQRSRRYESASLLAADLRAFLDGTPVSAAPPSKVYLTRKFVGRHAIAIGAAAAVITALAAGLVVAVLALQRLRVEQQRTLAALAEAERQRQDAQASNQTASAINQFLNDMLRSSDPERSRGRPITVQEVLSSAAGQIGGRFAEHPMVEAGVRETIGRSFVALNQPREAAQNLQAALDKLRSVGRADDPAFLSSKAELAVALHALGQFEPSQALFLEVVQQAERQLNAGAGTGGRAVDVVPAVDVLARSSPYLNVPVPRLEALFRVAAERREQLLGIDHPDTLRCRATYGWYAAMAERTDEGAGILIDSIARMERVIGPGSRAVVENRQRLSRIQFLLNRPDDALSTLGSALDDARAAWGDDHPVTLLAMYNRSQGLQRVGRLEEALALVQRRHELIDRVYADDSTARLAALADLGDLLEKLGRHEEALAALQERVTLCRGLLGPDAMNTRFAETSLARSLARAGRASEGASLLDTATPALVKMMRADSPRAIDQLDAHMSVLLAAGRERDAVAVAREVLRRAESGTYANADARMKPAVARRAASAAIVVARHAGDPTGAAPTLARAVERLVECKLGGSSAAAEVLREQERLARGAGQAGLADEFAARAGAIEAALSARAATQAAVGNGGGDPTRTTVRSATTAPATRPAPDDGAPDLSDSR